MKLVLFDIDGTLVPGASSEARFARFLWRSRQLGLRQLAAFVWFCLRYGLRFRGDLFQKNKAYLSGHDVGDVAALARRFVAQDLLPVLHRPAVERLRAHQHAGDTVVLLSGTPQFIADELAEALGVTRATGALCARRGSRYTSAPPLRHPYGATKIDAARELAAWADLPLDCAIAFGDSIHDAPLFRVVGAAVAVQPDRRLSVEALGAGWEVMGGPAKPI